MMNSAIKTHIGKVREENQDAVAQKQFATGTLVVVCDGLGGERAGRAASQLGMQTFLTYFEKEYAEHLTISEICEIMRQAVVEANMEIHQFAKKDYRNFGMATTCVAAFCSEQGTGVVNVGDSRAYRYTDKQLELITIDHTLVNYLILQGELTEEEAQQHPQRHMLVRAVGAERAVEVDDFFIPYAENTKFLLCSDGLHGYNEEPELMEILQQPKPAEALAEELLQLALDKGGRDNIAIAVVTE